MKKTKDYWMSSEPLGCKLNPLVTSSPFSVKSHWDNWKENRRTMQVRGRSLPIEVTPGRGLGKEQGWRGRQFSYHFISFCILGFVCIMKHLFAFLVFRKSNFFFLEGKSWCESLTISPSLDFALSPMPSSAVPWMAFFPGKGGQVPRLIGRPSSVPTRAVVQGPFPHH